MSMHSRPLRDEFGRAFEERRVLVTGASGFIGRHLCEGLLALGAEVHAVSRGRSGPPPDGCTVWTVDLANLDALRGAFEQAKPDLVYHAASLVDGRQDRSLVLPSLEANLVGAVHVALVCSETRCGQVVAVGSSDEPADDAGTAVPGSPYAAAKVGATLYFRMFHQLYQLPVVIVRPFMVYGPRQAESKLIPHVVSALLQGEAPRLASGLRVCDFVYVADVVRGLCRAGLVTDQFGETFDLGTGVPTTVREAVETLTALTGSAARPSFGALPDRLAEPTRVADVEKTRRGLGWKAEWSLEAGLAATVASRRRPVPS